MDDIPRIIENRFHSETNPNALYIEVVVPSKPRPSDYHQKHYCVGDVKSLRESVRSKNSLDIANQMNLAKKESFSQSLKYCKSRNQMEKPLVFDILQ